MVGRRFTYRSANYSVLGFGFRGEWTIENEVDWIDWTAAARERNWKEDKREKLSSISLSASLPLPILFSTVLPLFIGQWTSFLGCTTVVQSNSAASGTIWHVHCSPLSYYELGRSPVESMDHFTVVHWAVMHWSVVTSTQAKASYSELWENENSNADNLCENLWKGGVNVAMIF